MSNRFQRLLLIIFSLFFVASAIFLILINSQKNLVFFYTPSELLKSDIKKNDKLRLGGFVKEKSIIRLGNNKYSFIITDNNNSINIFYSGILPDLFRENQGVVIEGLFVKNHVEASRVFAKHDENYMPESIKKQLEQKNYWKKQY